MERKEIIFSILLTVTCIFFIVFLVRKNIEPHAYMGDFPPKNYQNKSSREKKHHDIHTAWGDMGYYPNKRNEYEYDGSDSSRTSDIVNAEQIRMEAEAEQIRMEAEAERMGMEAEAEQIRMEAEAERFRVEAEAERFRVEAEAERIRMQSKIAGMKSKAEQLRLQAIEAEKTRTKIEQEKYAAEADLKLSVINLSSALKELKQSSGDDIEFARANAEEMNTENKMLKQKLTDAETAKVEAQAAAAKANAATKKALADAKAAEDIAKAAAEAEQRRLKNVRLKQAAAEAKQAAAEAEQAAAEAEQRRLEQVRLEKAAADKVAADKAADYRNRKCLRTVYAKRLDSGGGWGMNLKFKCGDELVTIGRGSANKVTSNPLLLAGGMCPTRVDKSNWSKSHLPDHHKDVGDSFAIKVSDCLK